MLVLVLGCQLTYNHASFGQSSFLLKSISAVLVDLHFFDSGGLAVAGVVAGVVARFGSFAVLVNNAGVSSQPRNGAENLARLSANLSGVVWPMFLVLIFKKGASRRRDRRGRHGQLGRQHVRQRAGGLLLLGASDAAPQGRQRSRGRGRQGWFVHAGASRRC